MSVLWSVHNTHKTAFGPKKKKNVRLVSNETLIVWAEPRTSDKTSLFVSRSLPPPAATSETIESARTLVKGQEAEGGEADVKRGRRARGGHEFRQNLGKRRRGEMRKSVADVAASLMGETDEMAEDVRISALESGFMKRIIIKREKKPISESPRDI